MLPRDNHVYDLVNRMKAWLIVSFDIDSNKAGSTFMLLSTGFFNWNHPTNTFFVACIVGDAVDVNDVSHISLQPIK